MGNDAEANLVYTPKNQSFKSDDERKLLYNLCNVLFNCHFVK